jgi:hypothetical protein
MKNKFSDKETQVLLPFLVKQKYLGLEVGQFGGRSQWRSVAMWIAKRYQNELDKAAHQAAAAIAAVGGGGGGDGGGAAVALQVVDVERLFPHLDRGEGAPEVAEHQKLLSDVINGLQQDEDSIEQLFTDERWQLVGARLHDRAGCPF